MKDLEKNIIEKLEGAELQYSSNVWNNIQKEISISKQSNWDKLWILALFFVCGAMVIAITQLPNQSKHSKNLKTPISASIVANKAIKEAKTDSKTATKENQLASTQDEAIISSTHSDASNTKSNSELNLEPEHNLEIKEEVTTKTVIPNNIEDKNGLAVYNSSVPDYLNSNYKKDLNFSKESLYSGQYTNNTSCNGSTNYFTKQKEVKIPAQSNLENTIISIAPLPYMSNYHLHYSNGKLSPNMYFDVNDKSNVSAKNYFHLGQTSMIFNKTMESESSMFDQLEDIRNQTETAAYSHAYQFGYGRYIGDIFFFEVGIQQQILRENFSSSIDNVLITTDTLVSGPMEITGVNKYKFTAIPLAIGATLPLSAKWSLSPKMGYDINIRTKYTGQIYNEFEQIFALEANETIRPIYSKKPHVLNCSLDLHYAIHSNFDVTVGLGFGKFLGNLSSDIYALKQNISFYTLQAGTHYRF